MSSSLERGREEEVAKDGQRRGMGKEKKEEGVKVRSEKKVIGRKMESRSNSSKKVVCVKNGAKEKEEPLSSLSFQKRKKKSSLGPSLVSRAQSCSPSQVGGGKEESKQECPLCLEPLDGFESSSFFPCLVCSFQLCLFCFHRIRIESSTAESDLLSNVLDQIERRRYGLDENGGFDDQEGGQGSNQGRGEGKETTLGECPGCRTPYPRDIDAHIQDLKERRREEEDKILSAESSSSTTRVRHHEEVGTTTRVRSHEQVRRTTRVRSYEEKEEERKRDRESRTSSSGKKEARSDLERSVGNVRRGGKYGQGRNEHCDGKEEKRIGARRINERRREERKKEFDQERRIDSSLKESAHKETERVAKDDPRVEKDDERKEEGVNGANHNLFLPAEERSFQERGERKSRHIHTQERGVRVVVGMNGHGDRRHGHDESVVKVDTRTRKVLHPGSTTNHRPDHRQYHLYQRRFESSSSSFPSFQGEERRKRLEREEERRGRLERFRQEKKEERVEGRCCSFSSGSRGKGGKAYSSPGMLYDLNQKEEGRGEELKNGIKEEEEGKNCKEELIGILSRIGISNVSFRSSSCSLPPPSSCVNREERMKKGEDESPSQKPETVTKPS